MTTKLEVLRLLLHRLPKGSYSILDWAPACTPNCFVDRKNVLEFCSVVSVHPDVTESRKNFHHITQLIFIKKTRTGKRCTFMFHSVVTNSMTVGIYVTVEPESE